VTASVPLDDAGGAAGEHAERVVVDERMLFSLPDSVGDRAGALVKPRRCSGR
jgi:hypothetical protein